MDEHDRLGGEAFRLKYKFVPALRYLVVRDGRSYDSKAIVAAPTDTSSTSRLTCLRGRLEGIRYEPLGSAGDVFERIRVILSAPGAGPYRLSQGYEDFRAPLEHVTRAYRAAVTLALQAQSKASWSVNTAAKDTKHSTCWSRIARASPL